MAGSTSRSWTVTAKRSATVRFTRFNPTSGRPNGSIHIIDVKGLPDCRLYTFVDADYLAGRDPVEICRQLCAGGADLVQLRAKQWSKHRIQETAEPIAEICQRADVWFVIND